MNTRELADICDMATCRRDAYAKVLRSLCRDGNFEEVYWALRIVDKLWEREPTGGKG